MKRTISRLIACVVPCALMLGPGALAAPGDWDRSFGQSGQLPFELPGLTISVHDWLPQPDGRIVIAGHTTNVPAVLENSEIVVARFNTNGTLDTSFDGDGYVLFDFQGFGEVGLERQSDGKFLIVSQTPNDNEARLARLNVDGSRDNGYGTLGEVTVSVPGSTASFNPMLKLAPDGAALVVGQFDAGAALPPTSVVARRVTSTGTVDAAYGTGGIATLQGTDYLIPGEIDVGADGAILIGGTIGPFNNAVPFVGRINAAGQPAATFGTGGVVVLPFLNGEGYVTSVAAAANGKALVAGVRDDSNSRTTPFIARFNVDGSPDPAFGSSGRIIPAEGEIDSILVESDGKVVAAGTFNGPPNPAFLARYNVDGSPDLAFGSRGISRTDFTTGTVQMSATLRHLRRLADGSYSAIAQTYHLRTGPSRWRIFSPRAPAPACSESARNTKPRLFPFPRNRPRKNSSSIAPAEPKERSACSTAPCPTRPLPGGTS